MARFSEGDRERGMDMLEAAEDLFVDLGSPSRLGSALLQILTTYGHGAHGVLDRLRRGTADKSATSLPLTGAQEAS